MGSINRVTRGRRGTALLCASVLQLVGFAACSKNDSTDSRTAGSAVAASGQGGAASAAGAGGALGAAGARAGTGGIAGGASLTPPSPVQCGATMCTPPSGSRLTSCCLPAGGCGLGIGGECQEPDQAGEVDATCPSHDVMASGLTLLGCCKPNNQCGVMSMSGLGCVERTALGMFAGGPLEQLACVSGADDDAGVADDGGVEPIDMRAAPPTTAPSDDEMDAEDGGVSTRCVPPPWWARRWPQAVRPEVAATFCPGWNVRVTTP